MDMSVPSFLKGAADLLMGGVLERPAGEEGEKQGQEVGTAEEASTAAAPVATKKKRRKRAPNRTKGGPRSGPNSGHAVCDRAFSKLKPGEFADQDALLMRYYHYPHQSRGTVDITEEMAAGPANYDTVLAALNYITFPQNTNRKNVKKNNDRSEYMESMCLGGVFSWAKRSSYGWGGGAGGGNGMICSSHTQARPNLSRLLCRYCISERPGFAFTSIQVNKNYQSILHCDKRNLGPSAIVGLGDYTEGKLWGQEFGAVDLSGGKWVNFDGNMPHCTLPFEGTRYTLIYFINQSYEIMQPGCLSYVRQKAGFDNWPTPGLIKQKYKPSKLRIQDGKEAYRKWLQTPEGAGCTYTLPDTDDEDDEQEETSVVVETNEEPAAKTSKPRKQQRKKKKDTFRAGEIVACPSCLESMKAPVQARALRCANCRAEIYPETSVAAVETKDEPAAKKAKTTEQKNPPQEMQQTTSEIQTTVEPVELEGDEYAVESIIDDRFNKKLRRQEYRVRWLGYAESDDTWEPEDNFFGASVALLNAYREREEGMSA